jgi:hypothetical protein
MKIIHTQRKFNYDPALILGDDYENDSMYFITFEEKPGIVYVASVDDTGTVVFLDGKTVAGALVHAFITTDEKVSKMEKQIARLGNSVEELRHMLFKRCAQWKDS